MSARRTGAAVTDSDTACPQSVCWRNCSRSLTVIQNVWPTLTADRP
jgi:hypothetical protein